MRAAGYEVDYLTPADWLAALQNPGHDNILVLFGAEAFVRKGVVFPQILSVPEQNGLQNFMASAGPRGRIWCAAEAYKLDVADNDNELRETYMNANYSEIPASLFHALITTHTTTGGSTKSAVSSGGSLKTDEARSPPYLRRATRAGCYWRGGASPVTILPPGKVRDRAGLVGSSGRLAR